MTKFGKVKTTMMWARGVLQLVSHVIIPVGRAQCPPLKKGILLTPIPSDLYRPNSVWYYVWGGSVSTGWSTIPIPMEWGSSSPKFWDLLCVPTR